LRGRGACGLGDYDSCLGRCHALIAFLRVSSRLATLGDGVVALASGADGSAFLLCSRLGWSLRWCGDVIIVRRLVFDRLYVQDVLQHLLSCRLSLECPELHRGTRHECLVDLLLEWGSLFCQCRALQEVGGRGALFGVAPCARSDLRADEGVVSAHILSYQRQVH
jgi:hypothetical protein